MPPKSFPTLTNDEMRRRLEPPAGRVRLVIDTDAANEIDDQFAVAWALLSPEKFVVEGVYAAPYSFALHRTPMLKAYDLIKAGQADQISGDLARYTGWAQRLIDQDIDARSIPFVEADEGMELSYQEILTVYDKLGLDPTGQVFRGSPDYLTSLVEPISSPAAEHLIERAMAGGDEPLYVAAIGCLPNIASAILLEPEIIKHIVVLWTSAYPSSTNLWNGTSFNLVQDRLASQLLFDCGVPHVYLPGYHIGAQLSISLPEMEAWVKGKGAMGDYLYHLYTHNPIQAQRGITDHFGRTWIIWDLINFAWLINPEWVPSQLVHSP
ncbi:MAG: nucleoside hydrolase, partial [Anaerolineae bacterium]|nr:nucleoside hydrolase [Anaerolineae bacterium]